MTKQIPEGWHSITLKDVYDFKNGLNKEKSAFGSGAPIVNYMDVYKNHELKISKLKGLVTLNKNELSNFEVKRGDVFFTRTSETIDEIGLTAVMNDDCKNVVFSGFLLRARPKNNLITTNYAKYCFLSPIVRDEIKQKSSCTTRALTSGKMLGDVEVILPKNPEEQDKIVEILDTWARAVELQEQKVEKLKEKKKALMQKLLTPKDDWCEIRFSDICDCYQSQTIPQNQFLETGFKVYGANGAIGYYDKYNHENWQVVLSCRGNCGAINRTEDKSWINGNAMVLNLKNEDIMDKNYFYYQCLATSFDDVVDDSGIPQITCTSVKNKVLRFDRDKTKQKCYSEIFRTIDKNITLEENLLLKYEEQQKVLMQKLLTGEIRVNG